MRVVEGLCGKVLFFVFEIPEDKLTECIKDIEEVMTQPVPGLKVKLAVETEIFEERWGK